MKATQPLLSIVTPLYNEAEHLPQCIESVLAQTYQNWDYTIVNNRSTDASGEIARRYAAKDPRIRVLDNQHRLACPSLLRPIRVRAVIRNRAGYKYGVEFLSMNPEEKELTDRFRTMLRLATSGV